MSLGDLVTANYMLEYNGMVLGHSTPYVIETWDGLFDNTDMRNSDLDRNDADGVVPGFDYRVARNWVLAIDVNGELIDMETAMVTLARRLRPQQVEIPAVFARPGMVKKVFYCRPRKRQFQSNFDMAHGYVQGAVQLTGSDPLYYALAQGSVSVNLAPGVAGGQVNFTSSGDEVSKRGVITLVGPWSNPRITVSGQTPTDDGQSYNGFTIALDFILAAGHTAVIDLNKRSVAIDGVQNVAVIRSDNKWWKILPGAQTMYAARDAGNDNAAGTCTLAWQDAWG